MPNVNMNRRAREEAIQRRHHRNRADMLEDITPRFEEWMRRNGISAEQAEHELDTVDELIGFHDYMAEEGDAG